MGLFSRSKPAEEAAPAADGFTAPPSTSTSTSSTDSASSSDAFSSAPKVDLSKYSSVDALPKNDGKRVDYDSYNFGGMISKTAGYETDGLDDARLQQLADYERRRYGNNNVMGGGNQSQSMLPDMGIWQSLPPRAKGCVMQIQTGAKMGAAVGGCFGFLGGGYQAVVSRNILVLPVSVMGGAFSFGFFLGAGMIVRC